MSLLYILGPAHEEVNRVLRAIVHTLEMPDMILSHQKSSITVKPHQTNHHKDVNVEHDHKIIEFVEKILEGVDDSSESPDAPLKTVKYIAINERRHQEEKLTFSLECMHFVLEIENKLCNGYPSNYREPPQKIKGILI